MLRSRRGKSNSMGEKRIQFQPTPNPNSMKFIFPKVLLPVGMESFNSKQEAEKSPIARPLFEIDGVEGVFIMKNFISVNKIGGGNWGVIVPQVLNILETL